MIAELVEPISVEAGRRVANCRGKARLSGEYVVAQALGFANVVGTGGEPNSEAATGKQVTARWRCTRRQVRQDAGTRTGWG